MMTKEAGLSEVLWSGRKTARETMTLARKEYHRAKQNDPQSARIALASAYYTVAGRFKPAKSWHERLLLIRYFIPAAFYAMWGYDRKKISFDQIDVVVSILSKIPLRSLEKWSLHVIGSALYHVPASEAAEMEPHTMAFLHIRSAEIYERRGADYLARKYYMDAKDILPSVEDERQHLRIATTVAFFEYRTSRYESVKSLAEHNLRWALHFAKDAGINDQYDKILRQCIELGINLEE